MDKGRQGDRAWPLWGLVMRLIQAVRIEIEGQAVQADPILDGITPRRLSLEFAPRRRRTKAQGLLGVQRCRHLPGTLFLEAVRQPLPVAKSAQLTLYSCAINPEHCDTTFPINSSGQIGVKSYSLLRFELSQLSGQLVGSTRVRCPSLSIPGF